MAPRKYRHPEILLEAKRTEWGGGGSGEGEKEEVGREVREKMSFEFCKNLPPGRSAFKTNFYLLGVTTHIGELVSSSLVFLMSNPVMLMFNVEDPRGYEKRI